MIRALEFYNRFNKEFSNLDSLCRSDPLKVEFVFENNKEGRRVVTWLHDAYIAFERHYQSSKLVTDVPPWFIDRYQHFTKTWQPMIGPLMSEVTMAAMFRFSGSLHGASAEEIKKREKVTFLNARYMREYFYPTVSNGASHVDDAFCFISNAFPPETGDEFEYLAEAAEAWDFFRDEVRVDFDGIQRRWLALPRILSPLIRQPNQSKATELLVEALNAHLYGAQAAALAICRATCEIVLRQKYIRPDEVNRRDGKSKGLGDLIVLAEKRYEWIKELKLGDHKERGDTIMHRYDRGSDVEDYESAVREYIGTLKTLIEKSNS